MLVINTLPIRLFFLCLDINILAVDFQLTDYLRQGITGQNQAGDKPVRLRFCMIDKLTASYFYQTVIFHFHLQALSCGDDLSYMSVKYYAFMNYHSCKIMNVIFKAHILQDNRIMITERNNSKNPSY